MLYNFLLILLIIDGLILAIAVLLQAGQGGGLASMGGGSTDLVLGGRQAVTILHKASWVTGGLFMFLAILLSIVASQRTVGQTDVQRQLQAPVQQPLPAAPLQANPPGGTTTPPPAPAPIPPAGKQP
ncbi:MAG TPA: preprotein translocase subunit SecG [Gemmatimonadales bacterium]|jgi:protein translocase SecG subunit|nr:preprotein translocase subunit SecG [Gemmatimonadales bacterium]HEV8598475.1 preprotein translocase subunit SecG [Gemmatimonadales bacterium]